MKKAIILLGILFLIGVGFSAPARVHQSPIAIYVTLNQSTNITSTNITQFFQGVTIPITNVTSLISSVNCTGTNKLNNITITNAGLSGICGADVSGGGSNNGVTIPADNVTNGTFTGTLFRFSGNLTISGNSTIAGDVNLSRYASCTLKTTSWGMVICGGDNTSAGAGITSLGGSLEGIVQTNPAPVTTTGNVTFNTTAFNQTYDGRYLSIAGVRLPIANITNYIGWTLPFTNITGYAVGGVTVPWTNITGYNVGGVTVPWANITGFPTELQLTSLNITRMLNVTGDLRANLTNATFPTSDTFTSGLSLIQNISQLKSGILSITYFNLPPYTTSLPFTNITGYNVGGVTLPAANVTSGTFGNGGTFTFPLNLTVNGNLTILNRTNLTAYPDCTLKTVGGLVVCGGDNSSAGAVDNPFNQSLNTTDSVAFANVNISSLPNCASGIFTNGNGKLQCATVGFIDNLFYTMLYENGRLSPVDAQWAYMPDGQGGGMYTEDRTGFTIPKNGTITRWTVFQYVNATLGSNHNVTIIPQVKRNGVVTIYGTAPNIANITQNVRNTTLIVNVSIPVVEGDQVTFRVNYPTWTTNPTGWGTTWGILVKYNSTVTFS